MFGILGLVCLGASLIKENYDINYSKHEGCCNGGRGRMDFNSFASVKALDRKVEAINNYHDGKISYEEYYRITSGR